MKIKIKASLIVIILVVIIIGAILVLNRKNNPSFSTLTPTSNLNSTSTSTSSLTLITEVTYFCENNKTIKAAFYKGESKSVQPQEMPIPSGRVKLALSDGRNFDLAQTISADGGRYANGDESFIFWSKGNGAIVLENNAEKDYKGCIVISSDSGGLPNVYLNSKMGFTIRYPEGYSVDSSYKYQALGPGKDINGIKFIIPKSFASGTNLSSFDTGVSVEAIPNVLNCNAGLFLSNNKVKPQMITNNNIEYSFASTTDAGAGNRYEEYVWAFPGTNPCLAIRYFIHYMAIENYPSNTVSEFNHNALINQFDKIRRSFTHP
jgi:membrane-bound inhibitor of C-type lysozyme